MNYLKLAMDKRIIFERKNLRLQWGYSNATYKNWEILMLLKLIKFDNLYVFIFKVDGMVADESITCVFRNVTGT